MLNLTQSYPKMVRIIDKHKTLLNDDMKKCLIFILFCIPSLLFSQTNSKSKTQTPTSLVSSSTQSSDLIIKSVDKTVYSRVKDKAGYTQATLTGKVYVVYKEMEIWADQVVIKFSNSKAVFFSASGNVVVKGKGKVSVAKALYLYLKEKNMVLFDAYTLKDSMYVKASSIKENKNDLITFTNVQITTSSYLYPHYSLNAKEGYVSGKNDTVLTNAYMQIGQDPLVYFPVFYNNQYGTGIITTINYDYYLGFTIYNTFTQTGEHYKEKFMFDYYEKLGEYIGNDYSRDDIGTLGTHIAMAYDYHIKYQDNAFTNDFEQILGQGPSIGRSFRYDLGLTYENDIYKSEDPDGFVLHYKGLYKELSDPNFVSQFETGRKETFDVSGLLFPTTASTSKAGSAGITGVEGRRIASAFTATYKGYSLDIGGNLSYVLSPTTDSSKAVNSYAAEYYHNTLSTMVLPDIKLSKNFKIYTLEKSLGDAALAMPITFSIFEEFRDTQGYQPQGLSSKEYMNYLSGVLSMPLTYNIGIFTFVIPFTFNNQFQYQNYGAYDYNNSSLLESVYSRYNYSLNINNSPKFIWDFTDENRFILGLDLKTEYITQLQNTNNATSDQKANDNTNTYNEIEQTVGGMYREEWKSKKSDYLAGYITTTYDYSYTSHTGDDLPSDQFYKQQQHTLTSEFNIFKTTLNVTTYNQYGNNVLVQDEKGPLTLSLSSDVVPNLHVTNGYNFDRYNKQATDNTLELEYKIPAKLNVLSWFWFSGIDIDFLYSHNFTDTTMDYLTYRFNFDFNITALWELTFTLTGKNSRLYLYGSDAPSGSHVNFWSDLGKAFEFWDPKALEESNFKMDSFGFTVSHDLEEWKLQASLVFSPQLARTGTYYFDVQFYIQIVLKDIDALSAPKITKTVNDDTLY